MIYNLSIYILLLIIIIYNISTTNVIKESFSTDALLEAKMKGIFQDGIRDISHRTKVNIDELERILKEHTTLSINGMNKPVSIDINDEDWQDISNWDLLLNKFKNLF